MGRRDFQVKIRGFRIEVSEIETALREMDRISDAVVVGRTNDSGQSRLVAYFVPATRPGPTVSEIRANLSRTLPDYMVPSIFVAMDTLPRTPNGKTDRLRLPAVEGIRPEMAVPFSPPGTPTEETLARLWAEALGLDRVGVHDDFFELGGDSLLALKLLSRIEQTFQTPLSLKELLQAPTIAGQSARVVDGRDTPTRVSLVEVRRPADASEASRPPLVVGPTLFGHVGEWRELVQGTEFDRAVYGIEFHGDTAFPTERPTLEEIVSNVADAMIAQFSDKPVHLAGHSFGAHVAYELGQQLRARRVAPLSIVLVDAGAYTPAASFRLADFVSMAANLPGWFATEWQFYGLPESVETDQATQGGTTRDVGRGCRRSRVGRRGSAQPENGDAGVRLVEPAGRVSAAIGAKLHGGQELPAAADGKSRGVPAMPGAEPGPPSSARWRVGSVRAGQVAGDVHDSWRSRERTTRPLETCVPDDPSSGPGRRLVRPAKR